MARRHVMTDVEEKGLDHEQPHSDIHRGRLVATAAPSAEPTSETVEVEPEQAPAPVVQESQPGRRRKTQARQATEGDQGDPAAG